LSTKETMWIIYSLIMFTSSVILYVLIRLLSKKNIRREYLNLASFVLGPLMSLGVIVFKNYSIIIEFKFLLMIFFVSIFCSYLANKISLYTQKIAPNPGLALIFQKNYAVYTTFFALIFLGQSITVIKYISIIAIFLFSLLIIFDKKIKSKENNKKWIWLSFIVFFFWGNLSLFSRYLNENDVRPVQITFYLGIFVTIFVLIEIFIKRKSLQIFNQIKKRSNSFEKSTLLALFLIAVFSGIFNISLFFAIESATNIGIVNAINASSLMPVTVISAILFKDKISVKGYIGIVGIIVSLFVLFVF